MNDTTNTPTTIHGDSNDDERHAIQTYLSDMLALEQHIVKPLEQQEKLDDTGRYAEASQIVTKLRGIAESHIAALEKALDAEGGHAAAPLKSAWSQLLGVGAAAIGAARKTNVSKNLRDDYAALALASISYTMLHATALGLNDQASAQLAKTNLDDYAPIVIEIGKVMPRVVLQELRDEGREVRITEAELAEQNTSAAWQQ